MLAASAAAPQLWGGCAAAPLNVTQRQSDVLFVDNRVKLFDAERTLSQPKISPNSFSTIADVCASLGYGSTDRQQITVTATASRSVIRSAVCPLALVLVALASWLL